MPKRLNNTDTEYGECFGFYTSNQSNQKMQKFNDAYLIQWLNIAFKMRFLFSNHNMNILPTDFIYQSICAYEF